MYTFARRLHGRAPANGLAICHRNHDAEFLGELPQFVRTAGFPVLSVNVQGVPGVSTSTVLSVAGLQVGITAYSILDKVPPSARFISPDQPLLATLLQAEARKLREEHGCDLVVLLSHGGIHDDFRLATSADLLQRTFDLILGGHSHVTFAKPQGYRPAQPPIVHTGAHMQYVGVVDGHLPRGAKWAWHSTLRTLDNASLPVDPHMETWLAAQRSTASDNLTASSSIIARLQWRGHGLGHGRKAQLSSHSCRHGVCVQGVLAAHMQWGAAMCQLSSGLARYASQWFLLSTVVPASLGSVCVYTPQAPHV